MAIDDFGGKVLGKPIELLTADHQNKADIAASKAREWIDTQGISLRVRRHQLRHGPGHGQGRPGEKARLHRQRRGQLGADQRAVQPYTVHYAFDTVALAKGTGGVVERAARAGSS
jgi:branched-chain amino acid transport system substrate-binding protein